jgi:LysM repeat protein
MADLLAQLKQKYKPVFDTIQREGAQLQNVNMNGNQLYVKATAKSEDSKNRIWDAIKQVDPNYDNLSKISQQFYGDAKKYMTIAKANNLSDPDKIKVGQELLIPAA